MSGFRINEVCRGEDILPSANDQGGKMKSGVRIILYLSVLALLVNPVYAGNTNAYDYGKLFKGGMSVAPFPENPGASACVLFEKAKISISPNSYDYTMEHHVRIEIYNSAGKEQYSDITIPFYGDEKVYGIKAQTYLPDGHIVKLKRKNIFKEGEKKRWQKMVFAIPGVSDNCVIEYTYQKDSPYIAGLDNWVFQWDVEVDSTCFQVNLPAGYSYISNLNNSPIFGYTAEKSIVLGANNVKALQYTWSFSHLDPFVAEPFMFSKKDAMMTLDFQLQFYKDNFNYITFVKEMPDFHKKVIEYQKDYLDPGRQIKKLADRLSQNVDPSEMVRTIYYFVKDSISDGKSTSYTSSELQTPGELIKSRSGNRYEKNLLLMGLLRAEGLRANPVLISTRSNGLLKNGDLRLATYDNIIVEVRDGLKLRYLDARNSNIPYGLLPSGDISYRGLRYEPDQEFIDTPLPEESSRIAKLIDAELLPDGTLTGTVHIDYTNYDGISQRAKYKKAEDLESYIKDNVASAVAGIEWSDVSLSNETDPEKPFGVEFHFTVPHFAELGKDKMYFNTHLFDRMKENIFKLEKRRYSVDYNYPWENEETLNIILPEGFVMDQLSPRDEYSIGGHDFTSLASVRGRTLTSSRLLKISGIFFRSGSYKGIKQFFENVVSSDNNQIVIRRADSGK